MDKKLRQSFKPYSFRARMLLMLTISALVASLISLAFSYAYSRFTVRNEMTHEQLELAANLLTLYRQTELSPEQISRIGSRDDLAVTVVSSEILSERLTPQELQSLESSGVLSTSKGAFAPPVTFLLLSGSVLEIAPSTQVNLFLVALLRIAFAAVSFFSVFMLMLMLATWRIAKPISQLTRATRSVASGDFKTQLPENTPGEVGQLMRSFNAMTGVLGRTSYLQKDFIASISHEFRTPIASIKGFARLLQMPGISEEQRIEYTNLIAQESERLSRLSATLLRLSALEQQASPASLSAFRLDEEVRQVILRMEAVWAPRGVQWELDLDEVTITSDLELLDQVWVNLLQNAVKFSPRDSLIAISVHPSEGGAVLSIEDHGVGMDAETQSRIFDRFYQADKSRSEGGVGLGLTLTKRILDILCGTIQVRSAPGQGSTFTVFLPSAPVREKETYSK